MSAFNRRFQAQEIVGLPMYGVFGLLGMLFFGVAALLVPLLVKLIVLTFFSASLGMAWVGFYFGDDLPLLPVILAARFERHRTTCETWTEK